MGSIEVITSIQRRRRWSPEEKRTILEESEQPGNSLSGGGPEVRREHQPAVPLAETHAGRGAGRSGRRREHRSRLGVKQLKAVSGS